MKILNLIMIAVLGLAFSMEPAPVFAKSKVYGSSGNNKKKTNNKKKSGGGGGEYAALNKARMMSATQGVKDHFAAVKECIKLQAAVDELEAERDRLMRDKKLGIADPTQREMLDLSDRISGARRELSAAQSKRREASKATQRGTMIKRKMAGTGAQGGSKKSGAKKKSGSKKKKK